MKECKKTYYCPHSEGKAECLRGRCPHDDCARVNAYESAAREAFGPTEADIADKTRKGPMDILRRVYGSGCC